MAELLKVLACFVCTYKDDCEDQWETGHSHCDEMMEEAKRFAARKEYIKI